MQRRVIKDKVGSLLVTLRDGAHKHRFYIWTVVITVAISTPAAVVARAAYERAAEIGLAAGRLEHALALSDVWLPNFEDRTPEEVRAWLGSARAIEGYGTAFRERLSVAQQVTESAEDAGIADVRLGFADAPAEALAPPPCAPEWPLEPLSTAMSLEAIADFGSLARFIADLPRTVEARDLRLERQGEQVRAEVLLIMYEREEGDAADVS